MGGIGSRILGLTAATIAAATLSAQPRGFSFVGIGLDSDLGAVAARYPRSLRNGDLIYVDPLDTSDHISTIALSGSGRSRRLRVTFETVRDGRNDYPPCGAVQLTLDARYGAPMIRTFMEEAVRRADRQWQSATEEMTLVCFEGGRGQLLAEAVVIGAR
jgi:hypothetical protein